MQFSWCEFVTRVCVEEIHFQQIKYENKFSMKSTEKIANFLRPQFHFQRKKYTIHTIIRAYFLLVTHMW